MAKIIHHYVINDRRIALNNGEFRNVDKHQIAVADTNVQTPDYEN